MKEHVRASELKLGDTVLLNGLPFGYAIVKQIKDNVLTFFRPYARGENFSYTGGVICMIGVEEFNIHCDTTLTYTRVGLGNVV